MFILLYVYHNSDTDRCLADYSVRNQKQMLADSRRPGRPSPSSASLRGSAPCEASHSL